MPRWYLPLADVAPGILRPSPTRTTCPFKGVASCEHVTVTGQRYDDAAWCYQEPLLEALPAAGHRSFDGDGDGDGVEVEVDVSN